MQKQKKLMNKLIISILIVLFNNVLFAQKTSSHFQASFAYPLSTNGQNAPNIKNTISFNLIYGNNGGVNGFEIGGILNSNNSSVTGLQIGTVANITNGDSNGVAIAGAFNKVSNNASGVHISSIFNHFEKSKTGISLSGIMSLSNENSSGIAFSGVTNISKANFKGIQTSTVNITKGDNKGLQIGLVNKTNKIDGLQIGFLNKTTKINGLQIGFVNIADDADNGACLGLINLIKKNRYSAFELSFNEIGFIDATYKLGAHKLYTLFKLGGNYYNNSFALSQGLGLGSRVYNLNKKSIFIEASTSNFRRNFTSNNAYNILSKLSANMQYQICDNFSLQAGVSYNVFYLDQNVNDFNLFYIPSTLTKNIKPDSATFSWLGVSFGIVF